MTDPDLTPKLLHKKIMPQHDLYTWQVMRDNFICLDTVTSSSRFIDRTLKDWMTEMEPGQREQFLDAMFKIFSETDAKTLKELTTNWYKNALLVLRSLRIWMNL